MIVTPEESYLLWIQEIVGDTYSPRVSFEKLFKHLNEVEFHPLLIMDSDRCSDAISLRNEYMDTYGLSVSPLKIGPTVLEVMVALARRIEIEVMYNDHYGDRSWVWFWDMIKSVGLNIYHDGMYNEGKVNEKLNQLMDRTYYSNGVGGFFTMESPPKDLRVIDIWTQAQWYLTDYIDTHGM